MLDMIAQSMIWTSTYGIFILLTIGAVATIPHPVSIAWLCWTALFTYHLIRRN